MELAAGALRHQLTLDHLVFQAAQQPLHLTHKKKALLLVMAYQIYGMSIPSYAAVDQCVSLAAQYIDPPFSSLVNAVGRRLATLSSEYTDLSALPPLNSSNEVWARHTSYPPWLIHRLRTQYGDQQALEILTVSNQPPRVTFYHRSPLSPPFDSITLLNRSPCFYRLPKGPLPNQLFTSPDYLIQNPTPASLLHELTETLSPKTILDLCASPGGKAIVIHDLFPNASLTVNDISTEKCDRLQENLSRLEIPHTTTCYRGEAYPTSQTFDLILVDAPCSNTGVLHKRAEARWRLDKKNLAHHTTLQQALLQQAHRLLSPQGSIIYLTCSTLTEENEEQTAWAKDHLSLLTHKMKKYLPNVEGWDGGFGALLSPK